MAYFTTETTQTADVTVNESLLMRFRRFFTNYSSLTICKGSRTGNSGNNLEFSVLTLRTYVPWFLPSSDHLDFEQHYQLFKFFRPQTSFKNNIENGADNETSLLHKQLRHKGPEQLRQEVAVRLQKSGQESDDEDCGEEGRPVGQDLQVRAALQEPPHLLSSSLRNFRISCALSN